MLRLRSKDKNGRIYEFSLIDILEVDETFGVLIFNPERGDVLEIDPATIEAVEDDDAQVSKILDYIDKDIEEHPEHLIKPDPEMLAEIDELVDGVEIEEQPEDVILAALKAARAFIDAMLSFYGTDLQVANWHMNGDMQSWDSFFDDNMRGDELELLSAAIKKAEGTELIVGRIDEAGDGGQRKNDFDYVIRNYGVPACIDRRVIAYGKPGTIVEARGNYIGIHLDGDPSGVALNYHPTDGIIYLGPGIFKDQCEALLGEIRKELNKADTFLGSEWGVDDCVLMHTVLDILDEMEAKL